MPDRAGTALAVATAFALAAVWAPYTAAAAAADPAAPCEGTATETRGFSSVDLDGPEIAWTESTKYDTARAAVTKSWNALGKVKIMADTATTVNDLEWRDYSKADHRAAYWERHGNAGATDYIYLNASKLDPPAVESDTSGRLNVLGHELGHALGLCHKSRDVASILWASPRSTLWVTEPTDVDIANYRKRWG
ncbi:hypothetical protein [Streptomyces sp. AB3(2024)]|uniref:hypothetical protein n=1 Tax=Streptomyces sp. AB3(2024) TaxID=3317321 RepID=UPI0035A2C0CA